MDKVILENIVKMLTERKFLDVNNLEKNYTNLLKEYIDERIFKIKSDFSKEIYYLMMLPDKINTIKKVQNLEQFCANAGDNKKIIVGNFALKAYKQFLETADSERLRKPRVHNFRIIHINLDNPLYELAL